jgi:Ca2+-binding EF-hand superfamily protein
LDADKDGKLSKEEIDNAVAALKKLDKDGDGKLSKEEIGWPPAGLGRGGPGFGPGGFGGGPGGFGGGPGVNFVERIMTNDKDGDGKVTKEELPEPMQRIMQRVDTNQDGAIDKAEAEAAAATMGRRGSFGRGANPGGEQPKSPQPNPGGQ